MVAMTTDLVVVMPATCWKDATAAVVFGPGTPATSKRLLGSAVHTDPVGQPRGNVSSRVSPSMSPE